MKNSISYNLIEYIKEITDKLVTQAEFQPVRALVFGMAGIILVAVLAALIKTILK
jgi:uncharacterized protein YacL